MIFAARPVSMLWLGMAVLSAPASALPMTPEECDRARSEQTTLDKAGIAADMARGAEWGRANLSPDRLREVKRWMELQEQILFRCPRPKPRPDPAVIAQPDDSEDAPDTASKPKRPKTVQKAKPQSAAAEPENGDGTGAGSKSVKRSPQQVQPIKKPKPEDAYQPPVPFSGDVLQHAVPGPPAPASGTGTAP
jgi:septal ring-binding cell division protein DamX